MTPVLCFVYNVRCTYQYIVTIVGLVKMPMLLFLSRAMAMASRRPVAKCMRKAPCLNSLEVPRRKKMKKRRRRRSEGGGAGAIDDGGCYGGE